MIDVYMKKSFWEIKCTKFQFILLGKFIWNCKAKNDAMTVNVAVMKLSGCFKNVTGQEIFHFRHSYLLLSINKFFTCL